MSTIGAPKMTGLRLAEYRKARGKTQHQFALLINVSRSYLGDVEAGRCEPSRNFIEALLTGTDVSIDWILTGQGLPIREEFFTELNRTWCDSLLARTRTMSDSMSDSKTALNRTKRKKLTSESDGYYESDIGGAVLVKCPIRIGHNMADFLAELGQLTPEQQAQALEFIREKRRLNELEAKVSALAARR